MGRIQFLSWGAHSLDGPTGPWKWNSVKSTIIRWTLEPQSGIRLGVSIRISNATPSPCQDGGHQAGRVPEKQGLGRFETGSLGTEGNTAPKLDSERRRHSPGTVQLKGLVFTSHWGWTALSGVYKYTEAKAARGRGKVAAGVPVLCRCSAHTSSNMREHRRLQFGEGGRGSRSAWDDEHGSNRESFLPTRRGLGSLHSISGAAREIPST